MHSQPGIKQETKAGSSGEQAAVSIPIKIREGLEVIAFPRVDGLYFSVREFGRLDSLWRSRMGLEAVDIIKPSKKSVIRLPHSVFFPS